MKTANQTEPAGELLSTTRGAQTRRGQARPSSQYIFDNRGAQAQMRFHDLAQLYDARTIEYMKRLGIDEGWSCLEVGAGGGSIAHWLSMRVGPTGRVVATDIDPCFLYSLSLSNLEVWRHDLRHDPLPAGEFDLVHARLVLTHVPERDAALSRMRAAVKPGGWIVLEECDALSLLPDLTLNPGEHNVRTRQAFDQVARCRGVDLRYGRLLPQKLLSNGLVNVGAEATLSVWKAKSPGGRLMKLTYQEMKDQIVAAGLLSESEFEADMRRIEEQDFLTLSPMLWTAWGQVPERSQEQSEVPLEQLHQPNERRSIGASY